MIGDQPAAGVEVMLRQTGSGGTIVIAGFEPSAPITATTDAEGRYKIAGVAAGGYRIAAYAPAYVAAGESRNRFDQGKALNIAEGENVENVDFALTRGGVVTGKVTDEYGKPVIAEAVSVHRVDDSGKRINQNVPNFTRWETDDRGVYRIFGLEPGRYLVSAGASSEDATFRALGGAGGFYQRTFHPDAVEEAQAKIIELKSGAETESIDIRIARAKKGYVATGRVIESETGKPVPGVMLGYSIVKKTMSSFGMGNSITNSLGEFRLEGLSPNTYSVSVFNVGQSDLYSEPATFEIVGGDVTGVEIRMSRGSQISGTAIVEGTRDPAVLANLTRIQVYARNIQRDQTTMVMSSSGNAIGANGAFSIGGVRPGKVQLYANTFAVKGFSLIRVEHNGVEVKELDAVPGEPITGVRLVFVYGNAVVAGRVEIKGGGLPPGTRLMVMVRREGEASGGISGPRPAEVDNRGQFLLEGLAQGSYKLSLSASNPDLGAPPKIPKVEQIVTVSGNARQEVTLTLDLSQKEGEK